MDTSTILEATPVEATCRPLVDGFAALADGTRLAILQALAETPRCVCDLNVLVPVAANVLSYHLKILRDAGLVTATRRGRWVDYRLDRAALERLRAGVPVPPAAGRARDRPTTLR
jgi:ArsR family transcriptional regulator, arsenate/arsenite/antimonite-responsive transcriptional repressor